MSERDDSKSGSSDKPGQRPLPERDREAILARRRFLVASALASVVAAGCDKVLPQPCLEPPLATGDAATPTPCLSKPVPQPCLEVAPPPESGDAGSDFAQPPPDAEADKPRVCLRVAAPRDAGPDPAPRPCLKVAPADDEPVE